MHVMQFAGAEIPGGLLRHLEILTQGLIGRGHRLHAVLSPAAGADATASRCAAAGAAVTRLAVRGKTDVAGLLRFRSLVGSERPDILHAHLASPVEALPALMAARWAGARRLVTTEHAPTWAPLRKFYSRAAKRAAIGGVGAVIALSRSDAVVLQQRFGVPAGRLAVIPNGVPIPVGPPSARQAARSRLGLPDGAWPLIGYAGALEEKKGVLDLVEAASIAARAGLPRLAVAMAGAGGLAQALRRRAEESGVALHLCGRLDAIDDFLAALDLFALPSHQEAMPLALLEAMAAGLPVLAARVGGVPEAIEEGATGLLVEPARPGDLAAAIGRLCREEALRERLGAAAREAARRRFDAALMIQRVETLYEGLLAGAAVAAG